MKKITLSLLYLISITYGFAQTAIVLVDQGVVPNNFSFCFDMAPVCTLSMPVNNETQNDNPTPGSVIQLEFVDGSSFLGAGVDFEDLVTASIDDNGSYASMLFRSTTNTTGAVPVGLQLWASDDDKIDAFATYTKTDGTWQKLIFNFATATPAGAFTTTTVIKRINVLPNTGNSPDADTYQFDEIVLDQTLSVNDFETNGATKVYLSENNNTLNIKGNINGENFRIYDISGRILKTQSVEGETNKINVTTLPIGVYFINTERGSAKFIIPNK